MLKIGKATKEPQPTSDNILINKQKRRLTMTTSKVTVNSKLSFENTEIFVGLDVHKKSWKVTIRFNDIEMKAFSMNPDPVALKTHLDKNYPKGTYNTVYEAGFCGFWIHRKLTKLGINSIVVNPADIPQTNKDKQFKTDTRDSKTLAKTLENKQLTPIHIPTVEEERFRSIYRLRNQFKKDMTRTKNRIKSHFALYGIEFGGWSVKNLTILRKKSEEHDEGFLILELLDMHDLLKLKIKQQSAKIKQQLKVLKKDKECDILESVPGVATLTSELLIAEVISPTRFESDDQLSSYAGLVPSTASSGEKDISRGITSRRKGALRHALVEAAWKATNCDPELALAFSKLCLRMTKNKAIIRIAKKLLIRIKRVWTKMEPYKKNVNMTTQTIIN